MADNQFESGVASAILHFLFGAIIGVAIVGGAFWMFVDPSLWVKLSTAGALVFGISAAKWRGRFWTALANNPLFRAWRALVGKW